MVGRPSLLEYGRILIEKIFVHTAKGSARLAAPPNMRLNEKKKKTEINEVHARSVRFASHLKHLFSGTARHVRPKRFISDSEAFRQEERDKITKKRIAMAKYVADRQRMAVV